MSERYDQVRRRLVERGYLQGRIERFVLRDLTASHPARALAGASLKAAIIGAPILGGLLAASTVAANRPALGVRDAALLWGYFGVLSGIALFVLDLLAGIAAAAWARRHGALPGQAARGGLLVGAPVLAYLVAVWALGRSGRDGGADALFLLAAVGATGLVAWLAGIVSLAGIVGRTGEVPDRNRRHAIVVVAGLVAVAVVAFAAGSGFSGSRGAIPPAPFTPPERPERLLLVAVDGMDGSLVEALAPRGAGRHLLSAFERGSLFPKHRPGGAPPPEVWTTIATGTPADEHGVRTVGATRLPGIEAPIQREAGPTPLDAALRFMLPSRTVAASGAGRRVRTLWEIAGLSHPAASVGWWASWPARGTEGDPPKGYVVSDRALAKLLAGTPDDHDTAPESLFARLAADFPADRAALRARFDERFAGWPEAAGAIGWESMLIDGFAWKTMARLFEDPAVVAGLVYLPGLDILRTRLAAAGGAPADVLVAAQTVEAYVRWLDEEVFAGLDAYGVKRVVIVADPGRSAGAGAEGFVAVIGGGAAAACIGPPVRDLDVAPLVLREMGLPAASDMRGRAPRTCFERAAPAPPPIATWGRRGRPSRASARDDDPEMVERLKSLGYLR
jgi:hypothetical protein